MDKRTRKYRLNCEIMKLREDKLTWFSFIAGGIVVSMFTTNMSIDSLVLYFGLFVWLLWLIFKTRKEILEWSTL